MDIYTISKNRHSSEVMQVERELNSFKTCRTTESRELEKILYVFGKHANIVNKINGDIRSGSH